MAFLFIELKTAISKLCKPQAFYSKDAVTVLWPQSWQRAVRGSAFVSRYVGVHDVNTL